MAPTQPATRSQVEWGAILDRIQAESNLRDVPIVVFTGKDFYANYRKTPRNAPSGQVFADLGMQETGVTDGVTSFVFPHDQEIPDDGIITVSVQEDNESVGQKS